MLCPLTTPDEVGTARRAEEAYDIYTDSESGFKFNDKGMTPDSNKWWGEYKDYVNHSIVPMAKLNSKHRIEQGKDPLPDIDLPEMTLDLEELTKEKVYNIDCRVQAFEDQLSGVIFLVRFATAHQNQNAS